MSTFQMVVLNGTQPVLEVDATLSQFASVLVGVSMAMFLCLATCLLCLCCCDRRPEREPEQEPARGREPEHDA